MSMVDKTKTERENARKWVLLIFAVWYSECPQVREKRLTMWFDTTSRRARSAFAVLRNTRGFSMRVDSRGTVQIKISKGVALEVILISKCADRDDLKKKLGQLEKESWGD